MAVRIGTSGWQYRDWQGTFYPAGLPARQRLGCYAERFSTVEVNSSFYRLPGADAFRSWREQTPAGFVMAVKASRYLTHIRRLRDPQEPVSRLMTQARELGDRLGPVLLQLPPTLPLDLAAMQACLAAFPAGVQVAVEARHPGWWCAEFRDLLAAHGAALCWADRRGRPLTPLWRTADWGYLRMHEGAAHPAPHYGPQAITHWARRLAGTWTPAEDVYVYFNNDRGAAAPQDAERMRIAVEAQRG